MAKYNFFVAWITYFTVVCQVASSQIISQRNFVNYGVERGLPSSETYAVLQDKSDNIWIATDRGVVRFDGTEFRVFTSDHGLPDNVIFNLYEDYKGRIWFLSYNKKLSYFDPSEDRVVLYPYNKVIERYLAGRIPISCWISISTADELLIGFLNYKHITIDRNGKIAKFKTVPDDTTWMHVVIDQYDRPVIGTMLKPAIKQLPNSVEVFDPKGNVLAQFQIQFKKSRSSAWQACKCNGDYLIDASDTYYFVKQKKYWKHPLNSITNYCEQKNLWVGTLYTGVYLYKLDALASGPALHLLDGLSVTGVLKDSRGGYWFSTLEQGVFYLGNLNATLINEMSGLKSAYISGLAVAENKVLVGLKRGGVQVLEQNQQGAWKLEKGYDMPGEVYPYFDSKSKRVFVGATHFYELEKKGIKQLISSSQFKTGFQSKDLFLLNSKLYNVTTNEWYDLDPLFHKSTRSFECGALDEKGTLWLGTLHGLYHMPFKQLHQVRPRQILKERISGIALLPSAWVAVVTRGQGLKLIKGKIIKTYDLDDGLFDKQILGLYLDQKGILWAFGSMGVNGFEFKNDKLRLRYSFNAKSGLSSNEVTAVQRMGHALFIGTKNGLNKIDLNAISEHRSSIKVILDHVLVDAKRQNSGQSLVVQPDYKSMSIRVSYRNYRNAGKNQFRYRLSKNGKWVLSNSAQLTFTNLAVGKYLLEVEAMDEFERWTGKSLGLNFTISEHWWAKGWFISTAVFFGVSVLLVVFMLRHRRLTAKEALLMKMENLEQRALRIQMNPHFIFNALNSIQNYISNQDTMNAQRYLSRFARLMRLNLQHGSMEFIRLQEEIELLEKYLELEQLRFPDRLEYKIVCEPSLDLQRIGIPSMLIQPFVENAIKHGIATLDRKGQIEVEFKLLPDQQISCLISDNGIGRKEAKANKGGHHHQSLGMSITEKRLQLFRTEKHRAVISVYDKKDAKGFASGTEVQLILPFQYFDE